MVFPANVKTDRFARLLTNGFRVGVTYDPVCYDRLMNKSASSGGVAHGLPDDLAEALAKTVDVADLWEGLSQLGRNEFICWVENAKQEKTRKRRIQRTVEELMEGKKRPCCWVGCIHRDDKKPSKWQQEVLIDKVSKTR